MGTPSAARRNAIAQARRQAQQRRLFEKQRAFRALERDARIQSDVEAIQHLAPELVFRTNGSGWAILEGPLRIVLDHEMVRTVNVRIVFTPGYPEIEPVVLDINKQFKALPGKPLADRHIGSDGSCCLWLVSEWDATARDAFVRFMRNVFTFFDRQFVYDVLKRWPGPQWPHDGAGWAALVAEHFEGNPTLIALVEELIVRRRALPSRKSACPCGSGQAFMRCHRSQIRLLLEMIPSHVQSAIRSGSLALADTATKIEKREQNSDQQAS